MIPGGTEHGILMLAKPSVAVRGGDRKLIHDVAAGPTPKNNAIPDLWEDEI
jgi:hypothetical protein